MMGENSPQINHPDERNVQKNAQIQEYNDKTSYITSKGLGRLWINLNRIRQRKDIFKISRLNDKKFISKNAFPLEYFYGELNPKEQSKFSLQEKKIRNEEKEKWLEENPKLTKTTKKTKEFGIIHLLS